MPRAQDSHFESDARAQGFYLALAQRPMLTWLELAEEQRSDTHALQAVDAAAERSQHAPHLALATLHEDDAQHPARASTGVQEAGAHGARWAVVEYHACTKPLRELLIDLTVAAH